MVRRTDRYDRSMDSGAGCSGRAGKAREQHLAGDRNTFDLILLEMVQGQGGRVLDAFHTKA